MVLARDGATLRKARETTRRLAEHDVAVAAEHDLKTVSDSISRFRITSLSPLRCAVNKSIIDSCKALLPYFCWNKSTWQVGARNRLSDGQGMQWPMEIRLFMESTACPTHPPHGALVISRYHAKGFFGVLMWGPSWVLEDKADTTSGPDGSLTGECGQVGGSSPRKGWPSARGCRRW